MPVLVISVRHGRCRTSPPGIWDGAAGCGVCVDVLGGADTFAYYRETSIPGGYACAQSYHWGMQCVANVRGDETVEDYIA